MVNVHVQNRQESIWIALHPISLYRRPQPWLAQNELREFMHMKNISISLEQLRYEPFKGLIIDSRVGIKKIEINVDQTLLGGFRWEKKKVGGDGHTTSEEESSLSSSCADCLRLDMGFQFSVVISAFWSKINLRLPRIGPPIKPKYSKSWQLSTPFFVPYHLNIDAIV
jgi:hypothetical protein